jgi:ribosome recycling factor
MTEERRKELVKLVKAEGENAKVAIRNTRRDANEHIKKRVKDKEATEDEQKRAEAEIQRATDAQIALIDKLLLQKEQEILAV